jgi:sulfur-oxidizing protein SoxY
MTTSLQSRPSRTRRRLLQSAAAVALVPWLPANAAADELPEIPALTAFLAGRKPRLARVHLTLPQLADNGQTVPMKVSVDGPFAPGPRVTAINLFSEANPGARRWRYSSSRWRWIAPKSIRGCAFATTQRIVAVATMSDGALYATAAEVIVTIAGCMDGT